MEGKSRAGKAWNVGRNEGVGSREAGERLFTSPEHCGTHARSAAEGVSTRTALLERGYHRGSFGSGAGMRGKSLMRSFDKFGVAEVMGASGAGV